MIEQEAHDEAYNLGKQVAHNARRKSIESAWTSEGADRAEQIKDAVNITPPTALETDNARVEKARREAWITKDSGKRAEFSSGMRRDTAEGKPRFDLVTPVGQPYNETMAYRVAMLMTRGADKYGERNWELADSPEEYERFRASAYRHFLQWYHGEVDEDHAAAVDFNISAAEHVKSKL